MKPMGDLPHASVPPYAARWLLEQAGLSSAQVRAQVVWLQQQGRADLAGQLEFTMRQLRVSARAWMDALDEQAAPEPPPTSAGGSDPAEVGGGVAPSVSGSQISAKEAAMRLGITREAVGQRLRSGALTGRKVGSAWLVDRASVELAVQARRAS